MAEKDPPKTTDERLDLIIEYLNKMNKRDRLRTIGGFFRGIIGLIPIIFFLLSMWYVYEYGDQLLEKIAETAARQAAAVTTQNASNIVNTIDTDALLKKFLPQ